MPSLRAFPAEPPTLEALSPGADIVNGYLIIGLRKVLCRRRASAFRSSSKIDSIGFRSIYGRGISGSGETGSVVATQTM